MVRGKGSMRDKHKVSSRWAFNLKLLVIDALHRCSLIFFVVYRTMGDTFANFLKLEIFLTKLRLILALN